MHAIKWNQTGEKIYETGVSNGVLYPSVAGEYPAGVAWNGITAVNESPSGAEATPVYADNVQYLNLMSVEKYAATIEAYTYPTEFEACDGSAEIAPGVTIGQQARQSFGLCYKTIVGNDTEGDAHGYKIHIIYGALAAPSEVGHATVNENTEAATFSWTLATTPVPVTGFRPTASVTIDSRTTEAAKMTALEDILYGTAGTTEPAVAAIPARLPLPDEIKSIVGAV